MKRACVNAVPNVPCGVESSISKSVMAGLKAFLMYRVELKVGYRMLKQSHLKRS